MATDWFGPIPLQPIISIFAITASITASIALVLSRWYFEKIEKVVKQPDQLSDILLRIRQLEHAESVKRLFTIIFTILILFLIFSPIFLPITLTSKSVIALITFSLYFSLILRINK